MVQIWLQGLPWILVPLLGVWVVSLVRRDVSVIDVFWGPGYPLALLGYLSGLGGLGALLRGDLGTRAILIVGAVTLWALRLGLHLGVRWLKKGEEDARYAAMRADHPGTFPVRSLFTVFLLQGVLIWLFSGPFIPALAAGGNPGPVGVVGGLVFLFGLGWEAVADHQLTRFKADPANRGRVLDSGVWRYSRHPNYFGEAVLWWGLALMVLDAGVGLGVVSALAMTILLLRVSGVPMLEPHLRETRPGYAEYVARTSSFIPRRPRPAGAASNPPQSTDRLDEEGRG